MPGPCRNCEERTETCHATCERYLTWSTERRAALEKDYEQRLPERYLKDLRIRLSRWRIKNKARGRKG